MTRRSTAEPTAASREREAAIRSVVAHRFVDGGGSSTDAYLAVEEPLEIRVSGETIATTLRTPGDDRALVVGFLYAEGAIDDIGALASVVHCGRPGSDEYGNVVEVTPSPGLTLQTDPIARLRASSLTTSACGACGKDRILNLAERCRTLEDDTVELGFEQVMNSIEQLHEAQTHFESTGGLHAAALFHAGQLVAIAEDVGRHNAVDKVIGQALLADCLPERGGVLVVTSRAGFEIVQKACAARLPVVICLSAPTSLAVETAQAFGMTLVGFARAGTFNVYSVPERVAG